MRFTKMMVAVASVAAVASLATTAAHAVPVTGLRGTNMLFDFDTTTTTAVNSRPIVGVTGTILAIDYRPATGLLYGLTTAGNLYTIDVTTGAAVLASMLSSALSGNTFDISFNPTVDRLRIVSDTGQNLRVNVDTGAVTIDTELNLNGATKTGITAAAYTNQFAGAASTTLYDIDSINLFIQDPPNNGTLSLVAATTRSFSSFDIDGLTNAAYVAGSSVFAQLDLTNGRALAFGTLGISDVQDFAIAPRAAVPEPLPVALIGVGLISLLTARRKARTA